MKFEEIKSAFDENWIDVKDRLPEHHQIILSYTPSGQSVCIFVDGNIMASIISAINNSNVLNYGYYFCSQEVKGSVLTGVTHWMPLPEPPICAERIYSNSDIKGRN